MRDNVLNIVYSELCGISNNFYKELNANDNDIDDPVAIALYNLEEVLCGVPENCLLTSMDRIASKCKKLNCKRVYDIGGGDNCYMHLFTYRNIEYYVIDKIYKNEIIYFTRENNFRFINKFYPFSLNYSKKESEVNVAISNLCLGFSKATDDRADEVAYHLSKDFKYCVFHMCVSDIEPYKKYFDIIDIDTIFKGVRDIFADITLQRKEK